MNISLSNIINDEFKNNKLYCNNCGKFGHIFKKCKEPILSIGIINLYIGDLKLDNFFANKYVIKNIYERYKQNNYQIKNIIIQKFNDKNNILFNDIQPYVDIVKDKVKILMIRRKNSVGYIEFVRGRYDIDDIDNLIYLFNQMTPTEMNMLNGTHDFDYIWNDLWNGKYNDLPIDEESYSLNESKFQINLEKLSAKDRFIYLKVHLKEYAISKDKFKIFIENNLFDLIKPNVINLFDEPEWGFPKGKRNLYEKNLDCALREFNEETGINNKLITIMDRIYPVSENLIGTNNIDYKHYYYVGFSDKLELRIKTYAQSSEISAIGWFNYHEAIKLIRPYHTNKFKLLEDIMLFLAHNLRYYSSFNKNLII